MPLQVGLLNLVQNYLMHPCYSIFKVVDVDFEDVEIVFSALFDKVGLNSLILSDMLADIGFDVFR